MNELHNAAPQRELEIGGGTRRNEFDGGFLRWRIGEMREEHRRVVRTSQVVPEPESIIDDLTFALSPEFAHTAPPNANSCEPANEDTLTGVACDRRKNSAASRAGLERLDVRFAGAWGPALVAHILSRNRPEWGACFVSGMERPAATGGAF